MEPIDPTLSLDVGLLILRVGVGVTFSLHGFQKLFGWFGGGGLDGTAGWFRSLGFGDGKLAAVLAGSSEVAGGLGIALGLLTPLAAAAVIGTMTVAAHVNASENGFWSVSKGWELNGYLIVVAWALATTGSGRFSVDHALGTPLPTGLLPGLVALLVGVTAGTHRWHTRTRSATRSFNSQREDAMSTLNRKPVSISRALVTRGDSASSVRLTRADFQRRRLDATASALIVVDVQHLTASRDAGLGRKLLDDGEVELHSGRYKRIEQSVLPQLQALLGFFRDAGHTVVYLTVGSRTEDASDAPPHMREVFRELGGLAGRPEARIIDEVRPLPGELVLNKTTIDAFASTNLDAELRHRRVRSVLVAGVATSACVASTARSAAERGYEVALIEDACADTLAEDHVWALEQFRRLFGRVLTGRAAMEELAQGVR